MERAKALGGARFAARAFRAVSADLKSEIRASEARQEKQMGQFQEEFKAVRDEIQASEARQEKQMEELKKANEVLADKVDQLPDAFRAAKA